jgi:hypothetical protein
MSLCRQIDDSIAQSGELDGHCRLKIQKLANTAENAFADRAILLDENLLLFKQNNESAGGDLSKDLVPRKCKFCGPS